MKTAVSGQYLLLATRSTRRPTARSLFATIAIGVKRPGVVPAVWFSGMLITM
jgi:hypothetical protein